jgi:hypothetical protein
MGDVTLESEQLRKNGHVHVHVHGASLWRFQLYFGGSYLLNSILLLDCK